MVEVFEVEERGESRGIGAINRWDGEGLRRASAVNANVERTADFPRPAGANVD